MAAGADSIVAEVPAAVAGQTSSEITVERDGRSVFSFGVQISPTAPATFSGNGTGHGAGLILNDDGTPNTLDRPAVPGSTVTLFVTGVGLTPAVISATIGGQAASVGPVSPFKDDHCGRLRCGAYVPMLEGSVFEVPVTIPANTPAGPASVFVLIDGVASQGGLLVNVAPAPAN